VVRSAKKPAIWNAPDRRVEYKVGYRLNHAKHDRADKGESDIGGNDAQSADDGHGTPPLFTPLPCNLQSNNSFPIKKSAWLTIAIFPQPEPWLKLREINALNIG
jgi:hypothetical protein